MKDIENGVPSGMDDKYFTEIINETRPVVLGAIGRHLYPRFFHAIDDVAQETYIRAYRGLSKNSFRGDSKVRTWLYAIARNESLRMNRKLVREEDKFRRSSEMLLLREIPDSSDGILAAAELREKISELPELYRQVLELSVQGYNEAEISQKLRIKRGTVKSRSSRGREILRKIYGGPGYE